MGGRVRFYLGTHEVSQKWWDEAVPLFVSRRRLTGRRTLPQPREAWALDSGGFTELSMFGAWQTTESEYVADVRRFQEMGHMMWAAPQDWMCEPFMVEKTGLSVAEHQRLTVENFLRLYDQLGEGVIPVLQGWEPDEYLRCWEMYEQAGVSLGDWHTVGLGSVCRRQNMAVAGTIVRSLVPLRLHGFGVKLTGLESYGDVLASADSMAWSLAGRHNRLPGCTHKSCANCLRFAMRWRANLLERLGQQRLEIAA